MSLAGEIFRGLAASWAAPELLGERRLGPIGAIKQSVKAWLLSNYEATRWSKDRSWLQGYVRDARFDTTAQDLFELIRLSRNFERNNPLAQRLAQLWEQYTVGPTGFTIIPASSNEEWNKRSREAYDDWAPMADLSSRMTIGGMQCLASRRWFFDGRGIIYKTREEDPETGIGSKRPRIAFFEAHRLRTPDGKYAEEGKRINGGIEVDANGRPIFYHIQTGFDSEAVSRIPAKDIIDIQEPDRPWEMRPVPVLTPSLLPLHDLRDLQSLEMRAAKKLAAFAAVFKTRTGEIPKEQILKRGLLITGKLGTGQETSEDRIKFVREALGGEMIGLYPDEELEQPKNDRPGLVQQQYWDYLTSLVCIGVGIPKMLVFPHSIQGTVARFDMDASASYFRSRSAVLQAAFARVYHFFIENESRINTALLPLPKDWRKVIVRPPRSVLADIGRNSTARLNELKSGAYTFADHFGEDGKDWSEQFEQRAKEAARLRELAERYGVEPADISDIIQLPESVSVPPQTALAA